MTAWIFEGVAASYALACRVVIGEGRRGLLEAVLTLLVFNLGAAAWLFGANATEVSAFNAQLIWAVAIEGVVILASMLGFIFLFAGASRPPTTTADSRKNRTNRLDASVRLPHRFASTN